MGPPVSDIMFFTPKGVGCGPVSMTSVTGFSWFSRFQGDFHGSRWVFMIFHDSRLVFHESSWVLMIFNDSRLVFMRFQTGFYGSSSLFMGSKVPS